MDMDAWSFQLLVRDFHFQIQHWTSKPPNGFLVIHFDKPSPERRVNKQKNWPTDWETTKNAKTIIFFLEAYRSILTISEAAMSIRRAIPIPMRRCKSLRKMIDALDEKKIAHLNHEIGTNIPEASYRTQHAQAHTTIRCKRRGKKKWNRGNRKRI